MCIIYTTSLSQANARRRICRRVLRFCDIFFELNAYTYTADVDDGYTPSIYPLAVYVAMR